MSLRLDGDFLVAEVADGGRGFGPGTAPGAGRGSMRERDEAPAGILEVKNGPDKGTRVRLRVSVSDAWRDALWGETETHGEER